MAMRSVIYFPKQSKPSSKPKKKNPKQKCTETPRSLSKSQSEQNRKAAKLRGDPGKGGVSRLEGVEERPDDGRGWSTYRNGPHLVRNNQPLDKSRKRT